ncbi:MAG: dihydrodipicolinate synthase family protein [Thermomicrobiales bacterium]|nr:dihydrodipicolinate synthase family protein [Thermomicrobiales bacterium]
MPLAPADLKQQLRGVIAFTPTPFHPDERVDYDAFAQQVNRLIINGAHTVVVCGGVGEYVSLTNDEYRECISVGVEAAAGRVPLLAGIGHSTRIAADLAEYAATVGVAGLMINPLYFIEPPDAGLYRHYRTIADASGLGMMIFSTKGQVYGPDLIEDLAEIEEIIALKDEWGDLKLFVETRERLGDRLTWVNGMAETLTVPYFAAGAQAFTSGLINFMPNTVLDVWRLASTGKTVALEALIAEKIRPFAKLREKRKGYSIAVIKEAMHLLEYCGNTLRSPLMPMHDDDRDYLQQLLIEQGILTEPEEE